MTPSFQVKFYVLVSFILSQTKCSKSLNEECYIVPSPLILMTHANYNDLCPQPIAAVYLIICPLKLLSQPFNVIPLYVPDQSAVSIKSRDTPSCDVIKLHVHKSVCTTILTLMYFFSFNNTLGHSILYKYGRNI